MQQQTCASFFTATRNFPKQTPFSSTSEESIWHDFFKIGLHKKFSLKTSPLKVKFFYKKKRKEFYEVLFETGLWQNRGFFMVFLFFFRQFIDARSQWPTTTHLQLREGLSVSNQSYTDTQRKDHSFQSYEEHIGSFGSFIACIELKTEDAPRKLHKSLSKNFIKDLEKCFHT